MRTLLVVLAGLVLATTMAPASACDSALLSTFPDVTEIAKCVEDHEHSIALERQHADTLMALHEKLASLVYRQQDEIAKLSQEVMELKMSLALKSKKKGAVTQ